jgi:hypothetical protein
VSNIQLVLNLIEELNKYHGEFHDYLYRQQHKSNGPRLTSSVDPGSRTRLRDNIAYAERDFSGEGHAKTKLLVPNKAVEFKYQDYKGGPISRRVLPFAERMISKHQSPLFITGGDKKRFMETGSSGSDVLDVFKDRHEKAHSFFFDRDSKLDTTKRDNAHHGTSSFMKNNPSTTYKRESRVSSLAVQSMVKDGIITPEEARKLLRTHQVQSNYELFKNLGNLSKQNSDLSVPIITRMKNTYDVISKNNKAKDDTNKFLRTSILGKQRPDAYDLIDKQEQRVKDLIEQEKKVKATPPSLLERLKNYFRR